MSLIFLLCFLFLIHVAVGQQGVILWEGALKDPQWRNLTLPLPGPGECTELPANFADVTSSAESSDCVRLYENPGCQGQMVEIQPPDDKGVIASTLNDKISSVGSCKEKPTPTPPPPAPPGTKKKGGKGKKKFIKKVKKVHVIG